MHSSVKAFFFAKCSKLIQMATVKSRSHIVHFTLFFNIYNNLLEPWMLFCKMKYCESLVIYMGHYVLCTACIDMEKDK